MALPDSPPLSIQDVVSMVAPSGRRILDVGCGDGDLGAALLAAGAAEVVGVDACARGLTRARLTATYRVSADAAPELPYPDGYFDVVLLEDFSALQVAGPTLRHLRRWMKDDGRLVVIAPNATHEAALVTLLATGAWPGGAGLRPSTIGVALDVLAAEQFQVEDEVVLTRTEAGPAAPVLEEFAKALGADVERFRDGLTLARAIVAARPTDRRGARAEGFADPWRGSKQLKVLVAPDLDGREDWLAEVEVLANGLARSPDVTLAVALPASMLGSPPERLQSIADGTSVDMVLIEAPEDDTGWARLLAGASTWVVTTPDPTLIALARLVGLDLQVGQ